MQGWVLIIIGLLVVLLGISLILYIVQEKIIIHAEKLSDDHEFSFPGSFEEINVIAHDGNKLNGVLFRVKESRGLVFYLHNHSGNLEHCSNLAFYLNNLHQDVLVIDYRGFGKTRGKFSEQNTYEDIKVWYDQMKGMYADQEITVYGRGIGTAFATYLAKIYHPKRLILESPLYDLLYTAKKYYPLLPNLKYISKYSFNTAMHIKEVECPILILHGKKNKLIHYTNSSKLYELNKKNITIALLADGDHYNMMSQQKYREQLTRVFQA